MNWNKIEVKPTSWRKRLEAWTARTEKPHAVMCPDSHPAIYVVDKCSRGWAASYGYLSHAIGGHKTEFTRTDIIAVCETPELAMHACEQHHAAAP